MILNNNTVSVFRFRVNSRLPCIIAHTKQLDRPYVKQCSRISFDSSVNFVRNVLPNVVNKHSLGLM